jgi:hypothetical protein
LSRDREHGPAERRHRYGRGEDARNDSGHDDAPSLVTPILPGEARGAAIEQVFDTHGRIPAKTPETARPRAVSDALCVERATGLEPATYSLGSCRSTN